MPQLCPKCCWPLLIFSGVAAIGLGVFFPPTVILCFTFLAISLSIAPGWLTRHPEKIRAQLITIVILVVFMNLTLLLSCISQSPNRHQACILADIKSRSGVHFRPQQILLLQSVRSS